MVVSDLSPESCSKEDLLELERCLVCSPQSETEPKQTSWRERKIRLSRCSETIKSNPRGCRTNGPPEPLQTITAETEGSTCQIIQAWTCQDLTRSNAGVEPAGPDWSGPAESVFCKVRVPKFISGWNFSVESFERTESASCGHSMCLDDGGGSGLLIWQPPGGLTGPGLLPVSWFWTNVGAL